MGNDKGTLFRTKNGVALTNERSMQAVRVALSAAGLNSATYSGHSFRIGAATTAALCGIEDSTIKILGRWASDAYCVYIQMPREHLAGLSTTLSGSQTQLATVSDHHE